jgi:hypothetical protein
MRREGSPFYAKRIVVFLLSLLCTTRAAKHTERIVIILGVFAGLTGSTEKAVDVRSVILLFLDGSFSYAT